MATGGIFTIITNDGRQDKLLMATDLLNERLALISKARKADPRVSDPTPTLVDIEKTHIIFTNAHFKPFAAIGYEYNKVRASSGSPALGSNVQFSIPQFGDFFHDMVLHVKLRQPVLTGTGTVSTNPLMRWCAFPGERLMKKTQFEVNGNPLDEYLRDVYNLFRELHVGPNKRLAWDRCMGQEVAEKGFLDQPNWKLSGVANTAILHRTRTEVVSGAQTPTGQKDVAETGDLELFIPLLFWCNKDPRLAVPSVSIPYGQRFINVELAPQEELVNLVPRGTAGGAIPSAADWAAPAGSLATSTNLVRTLELYINNIFVNPEVHDIFIKRIGFTLIRVHRQQTHNANVASAEVLLSNLKWPIEMLAVGMRIKDYGATTAALRAEHLDKWHTFSRVTKTARTNQGWNSHRAASLTGSGTATLTLAAGIAGAAVTVTSSVAATDFDGTVAGTAAEVAVGDLLVLNGAVYPITAVTSATVISVRLQGDTAAPIAAVAAVFSVLKRIPQAAVVDVCARTVDTMTIKAHGIPIYNNFPAAFYNAYLPYHYGGTNLVAPEDCGVMLVPFCLYPGSYQPSGHINVSRAREFYLEYTSSIISSNTEGTLIVVASALNFLLISDGSAVLRYST
jgi:hypothetical protein